MDRFKFDVTLLQCGQLPLKPMIKIIDLFGDYLVIFKEKITKVSYMIGFCPPPKFYVEQCSH